MATLRKVTNRKKAGFKLKYLMIAGGVVFVGLMLAQFFYPISSLPLGTRVSGMSLSGWDKDSAIRALNRAYNDADIDVYLADTGDIFKTVKPSKFGLGIDNTSRIDAMSYPWYMRIVPTSLFWWGAAQSDSKPSTKYDDAALKKFVEKNFGTPCRVEPRNAMLSIDGSSINIEKSMIGGSCYQHAVRDSFRNVEFTSTDSGQVRIDLAVEQPDATSEDAVALAMEMNVNLLNDLTLKFDEIDGSVTLDHEELASWILFDVIDHKLTPIVDEAKSGEFYKTRIAPLIEHGAGVTTIIASEMTEAVRINGIEGRVINIEETNLRIVEYLRGQRQTVVVAVESTDPSINYVYNRAESSGIETVEDGEEDTKATEDDEVEETAPDELSGSLRPIDFQKRLRAGFLPANTARLARITPPKLGLQMFLKVHGTQLV